MLPARPPASHANPFCHVRVLHSSSLHVCAVWASVACPARQGLMPKVSQWPKKWALECVVWHPLLQSLDCLPQPRAGREARRDSWGQVAVTGRDPHLLLLRRRGPAHRGPPATDWQLAGICVVGRGPGCRLTALSLTLWAFSPMQVPINGLCPTFHPSPPTPQGKQLKESRERTFFLMGHRPPRGARQPELL